MLTIDMILAMSEDELRANYTKADLVTCILHAEDRLDYAIGMHMQAEERIATEIGDDAESTGTAVDEIYDFEAEPVEEDLRYVLDVHGTGWWIENTTRGNYAISCLRNIQWMGQNGYPPRAIEKWQRRHIRRIDRRMAGFGILMNIMGVRV